jgi:hypothetical protein
MWQCRNQPYLNVSLDVLVAFLCACGFEVASVVRGNSLQAIVRPAFDLSVRVWSALSDVIAMEFRAALCHEMVQEPTEGGVALHCVADPTVAIEASRISNLERIVEINALLERLELLMDTCAIALHQPAQLSVRVRAGDEEIDVGFDGEFQSPDGCVRGRSRVKAGSARDDKMITAHREKI